MVKKLWDALDGYKTYIGLVAVVAIQWAGPGDPSPDWIPEAVASPALRFAELLFGVGVINKADKLISAFRK